MRRCWRAGLVACGLWWASACWAQVPAVQRVFDAAAAQGFAGEVLIGTQKDIVFERAAGLADRARQLPHRTGAVWRWASVSKQVTAALVMQQVERGRLALDEPLARLWPDFPGPSAAQLTPRQLLQHLSGLPNPDDSRPGANGLPDFYLRGGADPMALCAGTPKRAPGERFEYNNCDTLVLAALLAQVTGLPFGELVQERLAGPLGLQTLRLDTGQAARATALAYDAAGALVPQPRVSTFGAAGALEGSARDLLAFDRALQSGRLLSANATRAMWTGEPRWGYVALGAWAFEAPLKGCAQPVKLVERRGDVGGIQVRNVIAPDSGLSLIVFTNLADFEFGEIWQGSGLTHDLLAAALCTAAP